MSFVRPELVAQMRRWREALAGVAAVALGAWWWFDVGGLLGWIGIALMIAGAGLLLAGVQRGRFRAGGGGPGVVQVDEGRIAYFGPLTGGVADLAELSALTLDPTAHPPHWVLGRPGQPDLFIPLNAEGAEALFDMFARLPGLRTERMLAEMKGGGRAPVTIWQRPRPRLH